ncbi:hypothetical protein TNCV_2464991 [Trichonephila clavipes]|uniref:DUF5641 domain-containing protein n=1 Tax=Trichonephila clavipes TaxID=2585209 RepID=A0A8X6R9B8_TRICX|nr:hypothetical protein TNCV_2464991 [Trichonephila clavipes]
MQAFRDEKELLRIRTKLVDSDRKDDFRLLVLLPAIHKGVRKKSFLSIGDVVLTRHNNVQHIDWPLGIILEVFPGKDGVLRVARSTTYEKDEDFDVLEVKSSKFHSNVVATSSPQMALG